MPSTSRSGNLIYLLLSSVPGFSRLISKRGRVQVPPTVTVSRSLLIVLLRTSLVTADRRRRTMSVGATKPFGLEACSVQLKVVRFGFPKVTVKSLLWGLLARFLCL